MVFDHNKRLIVLTAERIKWRLLYKEILEKSHEGLWINSGENFEEKLRKLKWISKEFRGNYEQKFITILV